MAKYKDFTFGQFEAVINKMGGAEIALAFLRGEYELKPVASVVDNDMIIRHIKVDRSRTSQQTLDATGRKQYTDKSAVESIPHLEGEDVEVCFFKLGRYLSCADLEKEYELRGLKPDPYAQAMVNEVDPVFADDHPNGSQWKDTDGNYTCVTFGRWNDERNVYCDRNDGDWNDRWWCAGVRK